jgi:hypothetical protein
MHQEGRPVLLSRAPPAPYLTLDHVGLVHELAQSLVEVLVHAVRATWFFLPVGIGALDREVDPAVILDLQNLHIDLLPFGQVGVNVLDEVSMNLRNVYEPCDIGRDLNERAEILKSDNLALHDGSWLN